MTIMWRRLVDLVAFSLLSNYTLSHTDFGEWWKTAGTIYNAISVVLSLISLATKTSFHPKSPSQPILYIRLGATICIPRKWDSVVVEWLCQTPRLPPVKAIFASSFVVYAAREWQKNDCDESFLLARTTKTKSSDWWFYRCSPTTAVLIF